MHYSCSTLTRTEARPMADSETLRAALREAEATILDVAKLIDPAAPGDRQAAEDFEAVGFVVRKWRKVLDAGDWPGAAEGRASPLALTDAFSGFFPAHSTVGISVSLSEATVEILSLLGRGLEGFVLGRDAVPKLLDELETLGH